MLQNGFLKAQWKLICFISFQLADSIPMEQSVVEEFVFGDENVSSELFSSLQYLLGKQLEFVDRFRNGNIDGWAKESSTYGRKFQNSKIQDFD